MQTQDTVQLGVQYTYMQTKSPLNTIHKHTEYTSQQQRAPTTGTHPYLAIPIMQTQKPALTAPWNNSYNSNSFQKQTKPHPEISYTETDNPYYKQTVDFGIKQNSCDRNCAVGQFGRIVV